MKEVVDEILAAEKKVEEALGEARREAARIRQESEKEVSAIVENAHEKAQLLLQKTVVAARQEAESTREKVFADAAGEKNRLFEQSKDKIDILVDEIVDIITTPMTAVRRSD